MDERLKRLIQRREKVAGEREAIVASRKAITDLAEEEAREELSEEEDSEFRSLTEQVKTKDDELAGLDERIGELADEAERDSRVTDGARALERAQARIQVTSEARTYERGNGRSYLRDLVMSEINRNRSAQERLQRHEREVETDKEYAEVRALDRDAGDGGYFVPPIWLMNEFVELARSGRPTANLVANRPLPPGTDSINIPKLASGTATAIQDGDNTEIENTDATDDVVSAGVKTIAGEQDIAVQLIEQSPVNFDEVIFQDLIRDYATKVDVQVLSGSNANGQVQGIIGTGSIIGKTWTEGSPTVAKLYGVLADAVQSVHSQRFAPPEVIVMHPRRWGWFLAALDTTLRPLVLPSANNPQNAAGILSAVASEQVVGQLHGLPVVTDPNLPINIGGSQDAILVLRASDIMLWESSIRTRVIASASGSSSATSLGGRTLTSTLQVYGYLAFTAARQPKSVAAITGSGLTTPDFSTGETGGS